ncbi:MAG: sulfite exporter TauE/SafE family protein [Peptostreptococcaceae bacterium]|jgi:uncharacterized membrane protein YfcA|nr:sulfite exporter TauE/SafE family protein [Peptostreptococcaceae bacterium]
MQLIYLAVAMFVVGFIDSMAGGGGLLSVPILLMTGLPVKVAMATNKMTAVFGLSSSTYNFYKKDKIDMKLIIKWAPICLIGSIIGTKMLDFVSSDFLKGAIPVVLVIALLQSIFRKKKEGNLNTKIDHKDFKKGLLFVFLMGFYSGFIGPATSTFIALGLIHIFELDFFTGNALSKPLTLLGTLVSFVILIVSGYVNIKYGIIAAVFRTLGSYVGTNFAIDKGEKIVKPIFLSFTFIMAIKMFLDMYLA